MTHNSKILKSLNGTWIDELLSISDEEIKEVISNLNDIKMTEPKITISQDGNDQVINFPYLLGEMNDFEKAALALLKKKQDELDGLKSGNIPFQVTQYQDIISIIKRCISSSVHERYQILPNTSVGFSLSKNGEIFAIHGYSREDKPVSMESAVWNYSMHLYMTEGGTLETPHLLFLFGLVS